MVRQKTFNWPAGGNFVGRGSGDNRGFVLLQKVVAEYSQRAEALLDAVSLDGRKCSFSCSVVKLRREVLK